MKNNEMTPSQIKKLRASMILPFIAGLMVVSFQNCSPGVIQNSKLDALGIDGPKSTNIEEDTKPTTLAYSENMLVSMQQVAGVKNLRPAVITDYRTAQAAKITESGKVTTANAPMMVTTLNLAGEICSDLVAEEIAKAADARRFFNSVNFTQAPNAITMAAKADFIRRMARNFWSRNESPAERAVITMAIDAAIADPRRPAATAVGDTADIALFSCSAMLAAIDSIRF